MCVCQQRYESWVKNSISSKCATGQLHEHTEMDEIISSLSLTLKQRDLDIKRTHTGGCFSDKVYFLFKYKIICKILRKIQNFELKGIELSHVFRWFSD